LHAIVSQPLAHRLDPANALLRIDHRLPISGPGRGHRDRAGLDRAITN
jgi:hypothetical protein